MCLRAYADSEGPDQPAHPRSLIGPLLSANRIIGYYRMFQWRANFRMRPCACQDYANLRKLRMLEGTFSPEAANLS